MTRASGSVGVLRGSWGVLACLVLACGRAPEPPSVVLVVLDTLRADAVSAYGAVEGTTPTLDALAAEGLLYRRALSPSPWTLPSHATLFTGTGIEVHGVGMRGRVSLPEDFLTLAERFQQAGYETAAFSENMLVSDVFQVLQGFRHRRYTRIFKKGEGVPFHSRMTVKPAAEVRKWLEERPPGQPFFLFVNLFEPHTPYSVRDENPWVPEGASGEELSRYAQKPERRLCDPELTQRDFDILKGLYLGDVHEADRVLGRILADVRKLGGAPRLITLVTSDHGELFGERGLLGHEFNLRYGALHVPLVVQGLDLPSGVIDTPVTLADVPATILKLAGFEVPDDMQGRPLPMAPAQQGSGAPARRRFFAAYSDSYQLDPDAWEGVVEFLDKDLPRRACGPDDKVFGGMAALIEYPLKYQWFERYPPELYDLSWDADERFEQAGHQQGAAIRMAAHLEDFLGRAGLTGEDTSPVESLDPEAVEALRALGYSE
ncbi:MAG: sulfatase [Myxococcota bacterium]